MPGVPGPRIALTGLMLAGLAAVGTTASHAAPAVQRIRCPTASSTPELLPPFSLPHPDPFGVRIPLRAASAALGAPVVLPTLPEAEAPTAGAVFRSRMARFPAGPHPGHVDVVFPRARVDVSYTRPAVPDPLQFAATPRRARRPPPR